MLMRVVLVACCGAPLAGCAPAGSGVRGDRVAARTQTDCLFTRSISDWQALDDRNLIVYASRNQPYHVELARSCFGLQFEDVIAFYDRSGDDRICGFGMDRVIIDRTRPEACGIVAVDALTEDQAEELILRSENRAAARD